MLKPLLSIILLTPFLLSAELREERFILTHGDVLDIDSGVVISGDYSGNIELFDSLPTEVGDSTSEFGLFGQGLLWMRPDGRNYTFFRDTWFANGSLDKYKQESLDTADTTLFSRSHSDSLSMIPYTHTGSGLLFGTQQEPTHDIDTNQLFYLVTDLGNSCLFKISNYYLHFDGSYMMFDLDSIEVTVWIQDDGSTDFSTLLPETSSEKFPLAQLQKSLTVRHQESHQQLTVSGVTPGISQVKLFSPSGRLICNQLFSHNGNNFTVPLPDLAFGMVLMQISNGQEQLVHKILLK